MPLLLATWNRHMEGVDSVCSLVFLEAELYCLWQAALAVLTPVVEGHVENCLMIVLTLDLHHRLKVHCVAIQPDPAIGPFVDLELVCGIVAQLDHSEVILFLHGELVLVWRVDLEYLYRVSTLKHGHLSQRHIVAHVVVIQGDCHNDCFFTTHCVSRRLVVSQPLD